MGDALGATGGDVAVGFVPANGALESGGYRAGAKTEFALGTGAIQEHFVARDFDAVDGSLRLAKGQAGKNGVGVGRAKRPVVGNFQPRRGEAGDFRADVENLLECEIFRAES